MSFDVHKIEAMKSVIVFHDFTAAAGVTLKQNIQVPFTPDFVVVKNVIYVLGVNDVDNVYLINCDFINAGNPITNFGIYQSVAGTNVILPPQEESLFMLRRPVSQDISFNITSNEVGGFANLNGVLSFQLEFYKLRVDPIQKVY